MFSVIGVEPLSSDALGSIVRPILHWHLSSRDGVGGRGEGGEALVQRVSSLIISLFLRVSSSLLPTPTKSHYIFNLRDVSKVIAGICSVAPQLHDDDMSVARLTVHEANR